MHPSFPMGVVRRLAVGLRSPTLVGVSDGQFTKCGSGSLGDAFSGCRQPPRKPEPMTRGSVMQASATISDTPYRVRRSAIPGLTALSERSNLGSRSVTSGCATLSDRLRPRLERRRVTSACATVCGRLGSCLRRRARYQGPLRQVTANLLAPALLPATLPSRFCVSYHKKGLSDWVADVRQPPMDGRD